ncbi:hypothetical protein [Streptomyces acidiscabies]|uniref:hypothetical protein n=1 Tax=Streptomyces acidiscabies TaxID=42234 RepID=UPI0038F7DBA5
MSNTTPTTPHAVPDPKLPADLTGAPAAIYTELAKPAAADGITATELALAAGIGRSTTGKALTILEEHHLAIRTPGGYDAGRRVPDLWHIAPAPQTSTEPADTEPDTTQEPGPADDPAPATEPAPDENKADTPEPSTAPEEAATPPQPATDNLPQSEPPADGHATEPTSTETSATNEAASDNQATDVPKEPTAAPHPTDDSTSQPKPPANPTVTDEPTAPGTPIEPKTTQQPHTTASPTPAPTQPQTTETGRLAPGGLRQMTFDHLQAHPDEAFTATRISRAINRSSGAIANALVTLTRQGLTEQVTDQPRTYRLKKTETNN